MRHVLLALTLGGLMLQPPRPGATPQTPLNGCRAVHKDAAVNTLVTVTTPVPSNDQFAFLCGWDWQAVQDATGGAQTNVLFTSTNVGSLSAEYSAAAVANAMVSGNFQYHIPIRADVAGQPITITSPAIGAHTAYSLNVYYQIGYGY